MFCPYVNEILQNTRNDLIICTLVFSLAKDAQKAKLLNIKQMKVVVMALPFLCLGKGPKCYLK